MATLVALQRRRSPFYTTSCSVLITTMSPKALVIAAVALLGVASVRAQNFTLPKLPFPYTATEPAIDRNTTEIHWTRHTQGYVNNLNAALVKCPDLRGQDLYELVTSVGTSDANQTCETDVRNQGGGTYNHLLFFLHNQAPYGSQSWDRDASPALKQAVQSAFGSFETFKARFKQAALAVFGSGWAWLCLDESSKKLLVTSTPNQDNPLMEVAKTQCAPILGLDVWEHGYYLRYQNRRADYIDAFWNVTNWREISGLYDKVSRGQPVTLQ